MRIVWQITLTVALSAPGWSSTLYSTGPIYTGNNGSSYSISNSYEVTNSFTVSSPAVVTGVSNIGLSVIGEDEDAPGALSWVISTAPDGGGTMEGSASGVALSSSFFENFQDLPGVSNGINNWYYSNFSINDLYLAPGTYYLELNQATTPNSENLDWIASGPFTSMGPSGADNGYGQITSEAFEIDGNIIAATPEPSGTAMSCLSWAVLLIFARLRKHQSI